MPEPKTVPVTLTVYEVRSDADIAVARLAADGIRAAVRQDDEGGLNPGFFARYGVRVVVDEGDLNDARESLGIEHMVVEQQVFEAMLRHSGWSYPNEGCGLIGVDETGNGVFAFCLTNTADSAHRFTIDPAEHFGAVRLAERLGLTIGGVFHSHVRSDPVPSQSDIDGGADSDWVHFIVGPVEAGTAGVRAYRITRGMVDEVSFEVGS